MGEQLYRQTELQVLFLLPDIPQRAYDQYIYVKPGVRVEEAGQLDGKGTDRGVSFTFVHVKRTLNKRGFLNLLAVLY